MRKVWPQSYVFIFCFILFDIVLALSKERKFAFVFTCLYKGKRTACPFFFFKEGEKDIFNNSVLGFLQGMTYILD